MKITVKLYASLREYLPKKTNNYKISLNVDNELSVTDILESLNVPDDSIHLVLLNGVYLNDEERKVKYSLKDSDTIAVWPPVAGG